MLGLQFIHLPWLLLLPLALLPFLRQRGDTLVYSWNDLLPQDSRGRYAEWLWKLLAMLTLLSTIIGLSGPGKSETRIERIGRGAEISILMDRSSSMDARIHRNGLNNGKKESNQAYVQAQVDLSKNDEVRNALTWLLEQRPENRYALTLFNSAPIQITTFTDDEAIVQSGLNASDIGRGPSETNMGLGLLAAIDTFEGRSYSGSRAILLVSDGGAKLEPAMRTKIASGLSRNKISLYFIYIESSLNSPNLELVGTNVDSTLEEVELHVFFQGLDSDYQVFQARDQESLAKAIEKIDEQHNLPLTYFERIPRIDLSPLFFITAALGCGLLLVLSLLRMVSWL